MRGLVNAMREGGRLMLSGRRLTLNTIVSKTAVLCGEKRCPRPASLCLPIRPFYDYSAVFGLPRQDVVRILCDNIVSGDPAISKCL